MAFNANIPQPNDQLSQSQLDLLANFQAIDIWTQVNHVAFNGGNQGKHTWVTFTQQVGATPFVNGEVGLSNYNAPLTGTKELFISLFNSAGTKFEYPISQSILSTVPVPAFGSTGFAYFPSGIIAKWGRATGLVNGVNSINLDTATATGGPRFTTIINVQLTTISGANSTITFLGSNIVPTPQTISINVQNASAVMYYIIGA